MAENILILCAPGVAAEKISAVVRRSGSTLGLVNTCIDPSKQKASGGRIEESRSFGGTTYHAFDEPFSVGSAIAQLAGYADAVLVVRLEDWARRLCASFTDQERITSEVTSVTSVLSAQLADVVLVSSPSASGADPATALHRTMLAEFEKHFTQVIDLGAG